MTTFLWGLVTKESGSNDGLTWHRFACNIERWEEKEKKHTIYFHNFTFFFFMFLLLSWHYGHKL